ncbi:VOC family protein [bacterium]|nr:VOC family protein [bacterium]
MNREEHVEPNVTQAVPLLAVSNMETALHFYVNGLGFDMKNKWLDEGKLRWCRLQLGAAALMLQEFKKEGHDAWVPKGQVGEGVSINFICNDALLIYRELKSKDIPAKKPFVGNGMWVTGLSDPDGYNLFFESVTDMPEDAEYSE